MKQAFIVCIQVLAGDKMQLLGMREITLEKKGKEDKTYIVKALRFNWGVDTMRVFSALTANPTIAEREYYIKGLSEVLKEQS